MARIIILLLFFVTVTLAQTVNTDGYALIGNGVTLEEAERIALNDAQQKAINSLGVFLESETLVINNMLSKDEINTITGAIIKSAILKSEKIVVKNNFVLKLSVMTEIDKNSFENALKNYQDRSKDKATIKNLIQMIDELQKRLLNMKKQDVQVIEIVDEINFSNKRLEKFLTTKQIINNEIEIQQIYTDKLNNIFLKFAIPQLHENFISVLFWETVPQKKYNELILEFKPKEEAFKNIETMFVSIDSICNQYNDLNLKIRPRISYIGEFIFPVFFYINDTIIKHDIKVILKRGVYRNESQLSIVDLNINEYETTFSFIFIRGKVYCNHNDFWDWDFLLPSNFSLSNIENIDTRIGRVNLDLVNFNAFVD